MKTLHYIINLKQQIKDLENLVALKDEQLKYLKKSQATWIDYFHKIKDELQTYKNKENI